MLKPSVDPRSFRDLDEATKLIAQMPEVLRKIVSATVDDTMKDVYDRELKEIDRVFDRPTPYVKRGLKRTRSGARRGMFRAGQSRALVGDAAVYFETFRGRGGTSPNDVMAPHVFGGSRKMKRSEVRLRANRGTTYMVPTRSMPRDQYGNPSGARMSQMLQELGMFETARPGQRRKRKNRKTASYFLMGPRNNPVGIGERKGKGPPKMMMKFRNRAPQYSTRYDFYGVGRAQALVSAPRHFARILRSYKTRLNL